MGGMYQQDHGDNAHNLPEMCVSLFSFCFVSHSHGVADGARLFYTTPQPTTLNAMRQCALHRLFVPSPDGAFDSSAIPVHNSPISQIHSTDHIVIPAGWDSRGKVVVLRNGTLTQSMALGFGARFVFRRRAKNVHVPRKPSKYILVFNVHIPFSRDEHEANPSRAPQQPDDRTCVHAKNYDENYDAPTATHATYSARTQIHLQPTAGLAGSLGASSFSLLAVGLALAQKEGRSSGLRIHEGAGTQPSTPSILGS